MKKRVNFSRFRWASNLRPMRAKKLHNHSAFEIHNVNFSYIPLLLTFSKNDTQCCGNEGERGWRAKFSSVLEVIHHYYIIYNTSLRSVWVVLYSSRPVYRPWDLETFNEWKILPQGVRQESRFRRFGIVNSYLPSLTFKYRNKVGMYRAIKNFE
mgnify:CR=1 FL=1